MARLKEIKRHVRKGVINLELRFTNETRASIARLRTRDAKKAARVEREWKARWVNDLIEPVYGAGGFKSWDFGMGLES